MTQLGATDDHSSCMFQVGMEKLSDSLRAQRSLARYSDYFHYNRCQPACIGGWKVMLPAGQGNLDSSESQCMTLHPVGDAQIPPQLMAPLQKPSLVLLRRHQLVTLPAPSTVRFPVICLLSSSWKSSSASHGFHFSNCYCWDELPFRWRC